MSDREQFNKRNRAHRPPATGEGDREARADVERVLVAWAQKPEAARAGSGEARLTEAERRAVLSHVPLAQGRDDDGIVAAVERILADRAAGEHDECAALMEESAERVEAVLGLCDDPWIAHYRGELARYQEGVSRRGALRYGEFVAVADIRAALAATGGDHDDS